MALIYHRTEATGVPSLNTQSPSARWDGDCAFLGHADLLLRDHDAAWRAIDLIGQSPLPVSTRAPLLS
jgi:hypothetical protein